MNHKPTNIYLDIDGILLVNDGTPANHANDFLRLVLQKYPDTTYWLTTHCKGDANVPIARFGHMFEPDVAELMLKIKTTNWDMSKTEAIDFSQPFLWFDDELFISEERELNKHQAMANWIQVNFRKDINQLQDFIRSFPIPVQPVD